MTAFEETTGVANMILLDNCDDKKLIENLKKRLQKNIIYTYIGEVLISVNPYKTLSICNEKLMLKYYNNNYVEDMPHIFAISAKVFKSLKEYRRDQCILISGESGSGKTEASKMVLQFIVKATHGDHIIQIIKDKLFVANSVLEAFGNAKTRNNDNSSRFGKYMDVQFNPMGYPIGGNILHYLLEKSRVVKQAHNERNYHIFYQLVNGADKWLAQLLEIDKDIDYLYLRTENNLTSFDDQIENEDTQKYKETLQALQVLEFDLEEKMDILKIVASVLHLGNIKVRRCGEVCKIENNSTIRIVCDLLGVPKDDLIFALTNKTIKAHGEVIRSHLDVEMSVFAKDALAKAIYSRLFEWLVTHINKTLKTIVGKKTGSENKIKSIGILDIYGFEILQNNGFEQFCINYCNEKLQKLFLDLTLKSEQEEYLNEGIEWTNVEYFDNGVICDMIEERHKGIISCLEDESLKQTDACNNAVLLNELARRFKDHKHFSCYQSIDSHKKIKTILPTEFVIVHFAGTVTYDASCFLEKNNDSLFGNLSHIMSNSTNNIIKSSFSNCQTPSNKIPETTINQFKRSLNKLMKTLTSKQSSYIRCIKPNDFKEPGEFDDEVVRNQVKYMGLIEILRIRKAGFAYRSEFQQFLARYKCLCPDTWPDWSRRYTAVAAVCRLIQSLGLGAQDYKIGKSKIMVKHPHTVFEIEKRFQVAKHALAVKLQSVWRGYVARRRYALVRSSVILCQRTYRLRLQRIRLLQLREFEIVTRRIVCIQKNVRRMLAMRAYKKKLNAVLTIRNFIMGFMTRNDPPNVNNCRFVAYKQTRYLTRLSETLPKSLLDYHWPEPPSCCTEVSTYLKSLHRAWLSRIYRSDLAKRPELYERLKFKLATYELFKGKKSMYPKSLKYDFNNDRDEVLPRLSNMSLDGTNLRTTFLYATKVTKFDRRGYKPRERILVVTIETILIIEKTDKHHKIKDNLPLKYVTSLQMTSGMDTFLLIKVSEQFEESKGDVLLNVPHLIECVTVISKQAPGRVDFINMQTNSCMKHDIRNSKNPGFIEFIPVAVSERKGEIRKGNNKNLTITG
ncbi:P-loop containing nucleoside triphosphate hydrolase,Myosin head, motor domain,IQ motif, EF-hand [Cinara cedri]|uniref:P-loop containing nucleoside triphosphate hydrolase,Myosin head, motor domain,IQ motif, EF-hand n=1 Tax=Cinara cedri TaxID=506608 RepID=A0A5E4MMM4_9HEMI|nr:P-loop containing nucleoside triphosphate hydrolase,Myosin head, motor domain,IQ motif, EF-hand [Cinara cedri]